MKINRNIIFLSVIVSCVFCASIFAYFLYRNPFPQPPDNPKVYGTFTPQLVWQFNAEDKAVSSPIANSSYIFVRTQNFIYALNPDDGKEQWHSTSEANLPLIHSPILANQILIVPENRSGLAAYSANTGALIWKIPPLKLSRFIIYKW